MTEHGPLEGRTVVVTGASSGIGRATADLFQQAGAGVHGFARRPLAGASFHYHQVDVGEPAALSRALERLDRLDLLVLAAGTNRPDRSLRELSVEGWDELVRVNLSGAYYAIRASLPLLEPSNGQVILVASVSAQWPDASGPAYQASKAGALALMRACGLEQRGGPVRFSTVSPGLVDTPLLDRRPRKPDAEVLARALRPGDVAEACLFLATRPAHVHVPELTILPAALHALGAT